MRTGFATVFPDLTLLIRFFFFFFMLFIDTIFGIGYNGREFLSACRYGGWGYRINTGGRGTPPGNGENNMKRPVRTTALALTVLALLLACLSPAFAAQTELEQTCDTILSNAGAAIIYDLTNEKILYTKNASEHVCVASITKVLNACVAVQYFDEDDVIRVGEEVNMCIPAASRAGIEPGERYTFLQLLHAMLLPSGCDVAYTLAAAVGRKSAEDSSLNYRDAVAEGVSEMNRFLSWLGCTDSHFVNPDGQDASNQYTTCLDYIKVLRYAIMNPTIASVVRKSSYSCTDVDGYSHTWRTTNSMMIEGSGYYYPGVKGIKTGTTDRAGCCLAAAVERNGRTLISLVVNTETYTARYVLSAKILDAAFDTSAPVAERKMGDINNDGSVTPADARLTLRLAIQLEPADGYDLRWADMDSDDYITPADARLVLRVSVGLE